MTAKLDQRFSLWKEGMQLAMGPDAFVSKTWLKKKWQEGQVPPKASKAKASQKSENTELEKAQTLEKIRACLGDGCGTQLCATKKNLVFGEGNPKARLMFIGEGPGEQEDLEGRPFVGRAGQLLTKMIEAMGLKREDVYIANVVKCRPPNNRTPLPEEVTLCEPFLFRQIDVIQPEIIVALGATALKSLLHSDDVKITRVRGTFMEFRGTRLMPTYHPAYLLRNPPAKKDVWDDLKKVMSELGLKIPKVES